MTQATLTAKSRTLSAALNKGFRYQPLKVEKQFRTGAALLRWGNE